MCRSLVPLGIILVLKMIPPAVLTECRAQAEGALNDAKLTSWGWVSASVIVVIWLLLACLAVAWVGHSLQQWHWQPK